MLYMDTIHFNIKIITFHLKLVNEFYCSEIKYSKASVFISYV